tara:strand:+ start:62 stop:292 length:231 start_codon:yes stop_codon:yes gene_type:complete
MVMGIFDIFRKEIYVNRLVLSYKDVHMCDDMVAINNLRRGYSTKDLKEILKILKEEENKGNLAFYLSRNGFTIFPY